MNTQEHVAYLGTLVADGTVYTGHLYEAGPGVYGMESRSVDAQGNQMLARMKMRMRTLEAAVTWGVCQTMEYILATGVDLGDVRTIHPASTPGIDLDIVMLAVEARAVERATEEAARATKH